MVDDPVYHGGRHLVIAEHRAPPAELQVRRDQHRLALVGVGEDLEHQPRALGVERQESEFVDDEKPRPAYLRGLPVQPSLLPCAPQPRDERGRREEPRLDPPLACERAERRGHVGLPGPDIAHQDQVLAGIEECEREQGVPVEPLGPRHGRPIVSRERLRRRQGAAPQQGDPFGRLPAGPFRLQVFRQVLDLLGRPEPRPLLEHRSREGARPARLDDPSRELLASGHRRPPP